MHDVFISYKSEDEALAMRVRAVLEANGVPCWIAARDIQPGANYAVDIPAAIESASVFVLVLTEQAQESPWILKELDSAIASRKLILPLLFGKFKLNRAITFLLTGVQYYDTGDNLDKTVVQLVPQIKKAVAAGKPKGKKKGPKVKKTRSHGFLYFMLILAISLWVVHYFGIVDVVSYMEMGMRALKRLLPRYSKVSSVTAAAGFSLNPFWFRVGGY